jgi:hypothetical protein
LGKIFKGDLGGGIKRAQQVCHRVATSAAYDYTDAPGNTRNGAAF